MPFEGQKRIVRVGIEYAGFWRRTGAYLIDGIILSIVQAPLSFILSSSDYYYYYAFEQVIGVVYIVGFWAWKSQTPGKMALGVKIVTEDGKPISTGRAIVRYFGYIVSSIPLGLGFFWVAWDKKKQGWHDKIANTYVIKE